MYKIDRKHCVLHITDLAFILVYKLIFNDIHYINSTMLHQKSLPKNKKRVTFCKDVKEPVSAERCCCCGHRNIRPRIRKMDLCMGCFMQTCSECLNSMSICTYCEIVLQHPKDKEEKEIEEYPELSDDDDFVLGQLLWV